MSKDKEPPRGCLEAIGWVLVAIVCVWVSAFGFTLITRTGYNLAWLLTSIVVIIGCILMAIVNVLLVVANNEED